MTGHAVPYVTGNCRFCLRSVVELTWALVCGDPEDDQPPTGHPPTPTPTRTTHIQCWDAYCRSGGARCAALIAEPSSVEQTHHPVVGLAGRCPSTLHSGRAVAVPGPLALYSQVKHSTNDTARRDVNAMKFATSHRADVVLLQRCAARYCDILVCEHHFR